MVQLLKGGGHEDEEGLESFKFRLQVDKTVSPNPMVCSILRNSICMEFFLLWMAFVLILLLVIAMNCKHISCLHCPSLVD